MKARAPRLIENFLEAIVSERGAARNTLEAYRRDLTAYFDFLGDKGATPLSATNDEIRAFQADGSARGLALASLARRLSAVGPLLRHRYFEARGGASLSSAARS